MLKSLISIPLLKEQLKRFFVIGVFILIFFLLAGILPLYVDRGFNPWTAVMMRDMLAVRHFTPIMSMIAAPLAVVLALYPYHFSGRAATHFYSFPVTKRQLYWTNMAAAMALMLVPLLIFCLILLAPVYVPGEPLFSPSWFVTPNAIFPYGLEPGDVINTFPVVAGFFARMLVGMVFYFGVFALAVSVSGHILVAILLCAAFPLLPLGVSVLMMWFGDMYVFGFAAGNMGASITATAAYSNPVMWSHWIGGAARLWPYYLAYIGITAALITLSYTCSRVRKLERAGDSVVFDPFKKACVFVVSLAGMNFLGAFMLFALQSRAMLIVGYILGFVIAYIVAQMIAQRSLNIGGKIKGLIPYGGITAGLYVIMLLITNFGMSSFIYHVPQANEVAGVSVNRFGWGWWGEAVTDNPETIARALEIHQEILDNRSYMRDTFWQTVAGNWSDAWRVHVRYVLEDGTEMERQYAVSHDFLLTSGLGDLIHSRPMLKAQMNIFEYIDYIEGIEVNIWPDRAAYMAHGQFTVFHITERSEIVSLLDAILDDHTIISTEDWYVRFARGYGWQHSEINISFSPQMRPGFWQDDFRVNIWLPSLDGTRAENVMAWLYEYGYREPGLQPIPQ